MKRQWRVTVERNKVKTTVKQSGLKWSVSVHLPLNGNEPLCALPQGEDPTTAACYHGNR